MFRSALDLNERIATASEGMTRLSCGGGGGVTAEERVRMRRSGKMWWCIVKERRMGEGSWTGLQVDSSIERLNRNHESVS